MVTTKLPQKIELKQKLEVFEMISGIETKNRYEILDENKQNILFADEKSSFLGRLILKKFRKLEINVVDSTKKNVMKIQREWFIFKPKHVILDEKEQFLGSIIQKRIYFIRTKYHIYDAFDNFLFTCEYNLKDLKNFKIKDPKFCYRITKDNQTIATIIRKYGLKQMALQTISDANNLFIDFRDIKDEKKKYLVLAAAFALDLHVWEK